MKMPHHFSQRLIPNRTRHRQALIDAILQQLQGTVTSVRHLHGGVDLGDFPSATTLRLRSLLHVVLGVEHRLLYPLVHLYLRVILRELSKYGLAFTRRKPFRVIGEVLPECA